MLTKESIQEKLESEKVLVGILKDINCGVDRIATAMEWSKEYIIELNQERDIMDGKGNELAPKEVQTANDAELEQAAAEQRAEEVQTANDAVPVVGPSGPATAAFDADMTEQMRQELMNDIEAKRASGVQMDETEFAETKSTTEQLADIFDVMASDNDQLSKIAKHYELMILSMAATLAQISEMNGRLRNAADSIGAIAGVEPGGENAENEKPGQAPAY